MAPSDPYSRQRSFWARVQPQADGCWLWTGAVRKAGYGSFAVKRNGRWTYTTSHRWAFEDRGGAIPDGYEVDHLCRRTSCVRPDHLEAVTGAENKRRRKMPAVAIDRSPRPLPTFPPAPPHVVRAPRLPGSPRTRSPICRNGHDKREVGTVRNGKRMTCAACRSAQYLQRRKGGAHGTETHCPGSHEYTIENTYRRPDGSRECRTCVRERNWRAHYTRLGRPTPPERVARQGDERQCPEGHDMVDPTNVGELHRRGRLERYCRTCRREINRRYRQRKLDQ